MAEWLSYDGVAFVVMLIDEYGDNWHVATWNKCGIPHCVHFNEGMQMRNYMRRWDMFKEMDAHWLDDNWAKLAGTAALKCANGDYDEIL